MPPPYAQGLERAVRDHAGDQAHVVGLGRVRDRLGLARIAALLDRLQERHGQFTARHLPIRNHCAQHLVDGDHLAQLHQHARVEHGHRGGRGGVAVGRPGVQRPDAGQDAEAHVEGEKHPALQRRVEAGGLEVEEGCLVYSYDIKVPGKSGVDEVIVDAGTGAVLKVEHESAVKEAAEKTGTKVKDVAKNVAGNVLGFGTAILGAIFQMATMDASRVLRARSASPLR